MQQPPETDPSTAADRRQDARREGAGRRTDDLGGYLDGSQVSSGLTSAEMEEVLGPIAPLVGRPDISEVMVMGDREVYIAIAGQVQLTDIRFTNEAELLETITRIVRAVGREIGPTSPLCDARLPDGSRVHAAVRPVAVDGPMLTIRKFVEGPDTPEAMVRLGCSALISGKVYLKPA